MSALLTILLAALGISGGAPAATAPVTLTVYAAASLTEAFTELGRRLEAEHAGLAVRFNFAGSQQLAAQIEQGAPADVFASADQRWMEYVRDKGLIAGAPEVFARNRLVLIVPRTNPARIGKLEDLTRRGIKLVVGAEAVPAGAYTREVLEKLGTAPGFQADYARQVLGNVVSQEENVKSVAAKVQLGEADAGFVYRSDVIGSIARFVRLIEIPDDYNAVAAYPVARVRGTKHAEAAGWFLDLVRSEAGQAVLVRYGLMPAGSAAPADHP